jgi:hypothetical protein
MATFEVEEGCMLIRFFLPDCFSSLIGVTLLRGGYIREVDAPFKLLLEIGAPPTFG